VTAEKESTKNFFSACLVLLLLSLRQFRVYLSPVTATIVALSLSLSLSQYLYIFLSLHLLH
jgi:hypothetical protein